MELIAKDKRNKIYAKFENWPQEVKDKYNYTGVNFHDVEECSIKNGSIDNFWLIDGTASYQGEN